MILGDAQTTAAEANSDGQPTLDDLFRRAALRRPSAYALIDAMDRRRFSDGPPRYVSYAAADRVVTAIAGRLHQLGLARDSVIALQMPNMVEGVLALLGVLRAGMIAAPLPLLWRREEIVSALGRIGAKAIISGGRAGAHDLCEDAVQAAAEVFSIRHVCGFGSSLADGVVSLTELFTTDRLDASPASERSNDAAAHLALITWDTNAKGIVPVARSHNELIEGGIAVMLEGQVEQDASILASMLQGSFAGLALTVVPWLLRGGTLVLNQPFDPEVLAAQCAEQRCDTLVLPGPLISSLAESGLLAHAGLKNIIAVWRNPERIAFAPPWKQVPVGLIDVQVFGETGYFTARRAASGIPAGITPGRQIVRTDAGTLALRGPMVPRHPFPPGAECGDEPYFQADASGLVDTGYPCRINRETGMIELSGPPASIVNVGGYRFRRDDLARHVGDAEMAASITPLPDTILSHRLAGNAVDREAVRQELTARGASPLIAGAFRDRRKPRAA